jgi:FixJ family two-component response regulator
MIDKILPAYPDIRVVFMSGYTDNTIDESEFLDKELNFLQKPFNAQSLVEKVREILDT